MFQRKINGVGGVQRELLMQPLTFGGPSAWARPLEEGTPYSECSHSLTGQRIGFAEFDHGVNGARQLGRDGRNGLAPKMRVMPVVRDVAFEIVPETVGPLQDGGLSAIHNTRRRRALPYFEILLWPRNMPDWTVARSMPQNFRTCR